MTVAELRAFLDDVPDDTEVWVGYESFAQQAAEGMYVGVPRHRPDVGPALFIFCQ